MVGWGLIGTGRVHRWLAAAICSAPDSALVGVLSRDAARAEAFAREFGAANAYVHIHDLLNDARIDVVYVASPNGLHATHTVEAAKAGRHVLCEKPMATSVSDCVHMIKACRSQPVLLGLGFQYRHHPALQKAKSLVASGKLGDIVFANATAHVPSSWKPDWYYNGLSGGGAMQTVGVHRIDILRYVLGLEVEQASAFVGGVTEQRPFEETVMGTLKFEGGAYGALQFGINVSHGSNCLEIHGTKGSVYCQDVFSQWFGGGGGEILMKTAAGDERLQFEKQDLYLAEVEDFNRCVTSGMEPTAGGEDGLRAIEVETALYESGSSGNVMAIARNEVPG